MGDLLKLLYVLRAVGEIATFENNTQNFVIQTI